MIKISKSSWHYKLSRYVMGGAMPKSLCPYFWGVVLSIVLAAPAGVCKKIGALLDRWFDYNEPSPPSKLEVWLNHWVPLVLAGCTGGLLLSLVVVEPRLSIGILIFVVTILGFLAGLAWLFNVLTHKKNGTAIKEPGLLRLYYRAVKSKVCPLIEYQSGRSDD